MDQESERLTTLINLVLTGRKWLLLYESSDRQSSAMITNNEEDHKNYICEVLLATIEKLQRGEFK